MTEKTVGIDGRRPLIQGVDDGQLGVLRQPHLPPQRGQGGILLTLRQRQARLALGLDQAHQDDVQLRDLPGALARLGDTGQRRILLRLGDCRRGETGRRIRLQPTGSAGHGRRPAAPAAPRPAPEPAARRPGGARTVAAPDRFSGHCSVAITSVVVTRPPTRRGPATTANSGLSVHAAAPTRRALASAVRARAMRLCGPACLARATMCSAVRTMGASAAAAAAAAAGATTVKAPRIPMMKQISRSRGCRPPAA